MPVRADGLKLDIGSVMDIDFIMTVLKQMGTGFSCKLLPADTELITIV